MRSRREREQKREEFSRGILGDSEAFPKHPAKAALVCGPQAMALTTHTPGSVCSCPNLGGRGGALSLIQIWKRARGGQVVTSPGLHGGTSFRSHLQGGTP